MTGPDEYSPEAKPRVRNNRTLTMNEASKGQTQSEDSLYAILSRLTRQCSSEAGTPPNFYFQAQEWVKIPNAFDSQNRPVWYKPDAIVGGLLFGDGIIRVQGNVHKTHKHQLRDPIQKERFERLGYWVEDIENKDVKQANVEAILAKHRRSTDKYGRQM